MGTDIAFTFSYSVIDNGSNTLLWQIGMFTISYLSSAKLVDKLARTSIFGYFFIKYEPIRFAQTFPLIR